MPGTKTSPRMSLPNPTDPKTTSLAYPTNFNSGAAYCSCVFTFIFFPFLDGTSVGSPWVLRSDLWNFRFRHPSAGYCQVPLADKSGKWDNVPDPKMERKPNAQCVRAFSRAARSLAALLAASASLFALQPSHSVTQYGHTSWGQQDGRLPGAVYALTQTLDGSLWVGTEFGLFRFDGVTFAPWQPPPGRQLPSRVISALAPAPDGGLWIGTSNGLSYWKGNQLKHYPIGQGTAVSSVIADRAGAVWVGTVGFNSGALCRLQAGRLACYTPADGYEGNGVLSLLEDSGDNLWIACAGGLYRLNSSGFRHYGPNKSIQAVTGTGDGGIIVPSSGGLMKLANERFVNYSTNKAIRDAHKRVLFSDRDGGLWIGTTGSGLIHLYEGQEDGFSHADGLSSDTILSLFEDRESDIWVGTERGLDRFRDLPVTTLSRREGLSADTVQSAFSSKQGGVWLGTTEGLNRAWAGGIDVNGARLLFPFKGVDSLFEDRAGTLWVDSSRGLAFTNGARLEWLELPGGRPIRSIAAAEEDRDGALWFSDLDYGLIRVEGHQIVKVIPWSQFQNRLAIALNVDPVQGGLWLGFQQGEVAYVGENNYQARWYTESDGLGSGAVTDLHSEADGTVWISTQGGLSRLRNGRIATFGLNNGLPCEQVHAMVEDDDRNLWLETPCGLLRIARVDLAAWSANPKMKIEPAIFGARDGVHLRSTNNGYFRRAVKSGDGRLWFPEFDGVAIVDPRQLPHNPLPPPVEIESIVVDRVAHPIHPGLRLPHISQGLQIDYTAFSFVDPGQVRFKYKLVGYDADWLDAAERRQAFYPSLRPGHYVFRVIAANNDGVWNNAGASVDFSVAPTFYQADWFLVLCAASISGILWTSYHVRVKRIEARLSLRLEERLKERTRIARDLHDTLLQNISGIALQLDALSKIVTAPLSAKDRIRELRRDTENWLSETRELVSDLRAESSEGDDLATAIQKIGSQVTAGKEIAFRVRNSGHSRGIDARTRRNLLQIAQEAVRNAASHSNATEIDVHLSYAGDDQLRIEIYDNGCGFDFEAASRRPRHWGLTTMRERAEEIGAELRIDTSPGQGVKIEVCSPITSPSESRDND
jgi:signal transduction histidine kinase/ligand-binding sensor domain-containing protein